MVQPQINGLELLGLVGEGACGYVFIARDTDKNAPIFPDTPWYAVRVFNALAVNRPLIENMVKRLEGQTYPEGLIPLVWKQSHQGSLCMVMPLLAEVDEEERTITPNTLQRRIEEFPEKNAWELIDKIAHALAEMHQARIPHGNLKPGNIFFDEKENPFLSDFAMGHMPGVSMLPYTDALLYAPPEQLREPEGYLTGKGYTWDTYAFGVLAFRLLTGKFPRCEGTFSQAAPHGGESHVTGIRADVNKLAERLEHREIETWPEETSDPLEQKRRAVILRCLALNPKDRYPNLLEVIRAWNTIDTDAQVAKDKNTLIQKAARSKLWMKGALILASIGALGCIVLGGWLAAEKLGRSSDKKDFDSKIANLQIERNKAVANEARAVQAKKIAESHEQTLIDNAAKIKAELLTQVNAIGTTNDHLLAWIIREQDSELPELQQSTSYQEIITTELQNFLKNTEGATHYQALRTRITLQLAELALNAKHPEKAAPYIDRAAENWKKASIKDADYPSRIARARLLCLLQSLDTQNAKLTQELLPKAREEIKALTNSSPDNTESRRINAVMQIIDGRLIEEKEPSKAIEYFQRALKDLQGLHKALPDNIALRSELARNQLHTAALAESLNRVDDAAQLRSEAAVHLQAILKKNPKLKLAKLQLAEIEILAAEADMRAGLDNQANTRLTRIQKLLTSLPANDISPRGVAMQIAIYKELRAVLLRDRGRTTEAAKILDDAIKSTQKIVKANPKSKEPLYRLAIFHWLRAGISGDNGDTKGELTEGKKAAELMQQLLKNGASHRDMELRRSLAYLYGDLGHTCYSKGKKSAAATFFKNATDMWSSLIEKNGKREEYTEGMKWSKSRYRAAGGK